MPYLPLPPPQPPAIVQALLPEETSSASTAPVTSKSDRAASVQAQVPTPSTTVISPVSSAPSDPPTSAQASPDLDQQERSSSRKGLDTTSLQQAASDLASDQPGVTSNSFSKRPTGTSASQPNEPVKLAKPKVPDSSSSNQGPQTEVASSTSKPGVVPDLSASPKGSEQTSISQSQSTPNLWELASGHTVVSQVGTEGGIKEPLKFQVNSPEYNSIHQSLAAAGRALGSLVLTSEPRPEAPVAANQEGLARPSNVQTQSQVRDPTATFAVNLLKHYGFEGELTAEQLADQWQQVYPSDWIRLAPIEALYQGRYKAVSVEKILATWQRQGQPLYHFNQTFEQFVSDQLSQELSVVGNQTSGTEQQTTPANPAAKELIASTLDDSFLESPLPASDTPLPRLGERTGFSSSAELGAPVSSAERVRATHDHPINELDLKAPSPASRLEPVAQTSPVPGSVREESPGPVLRDDDGEPLELYADRQEYDDVNQVFTAIGNVLLRFREATLRANQLQVNLQTQLATAEGNVSLTRGQQRLQGDRLEYNYVQNQGNLLNARGEIYFPTASTDISATPPTGEPTGFPSDNDETGIDDINPDGPPLSEQIQENQPQQIRTTEEIQRLRFEAERIEFDARGWEAQDIRITNDPFSPPELEVRAEEARLVRVSSLEDRVEATQPRLVFDQGLSLPILRSRVTFDRQQRDPAIAQVGFDNSERGGFFIGRTFEPLSTDQTSLTITPQFFPQRAVETGNFNPVDPDLYGLDVRLNSTLSPLTSLTGAVVLTNLDPPDIGDNLRANLRLRRPVETPVGAHRLTLEYAYRDRVYNGSEGFQDIQNSLGAILTSPTIALGNTGIDLNYQVGTQYITAETDQFGLANPGSLGRFQARASLGRGFYLWQGEALPATATAGLRYTSEPVVPYLQLFTRLTGTASAYTNGDTQETLLGRVGLQGQFGNFSRPFLDYTGFNISYSQIGLLGLSPFLFDRVTDFKVLSAGIVQQIYGPIRAGVQVSLSLDTGEVFDTEFLVEYSRRTYGVFLRYNPSRQIGSINFQLNGFNWTGGTAPFSGPERP